MDKKNKPKKDLSSNPSLFPPNSNNTESSSSAQPPQYENPSQYPPTSQQQQCIVVNNPHPFVFWGGGQQAVSMTGAIVLSCFAFWCFGWLFGMIAFILAMVGQSSAAAGDIPGAIRMRNASYGVSIAGIVVGVIAIIIIGSVLGTAASRIANNPSYCYYYYSYGYGIAYTCY